MRWGRGAGIWLVVAVATLSACSYTTRELPTIPPNAQSSRVFASDGTLITVLHGEQNREEIPLARMPQHLKDAVVAIEDERFWDHKGVDLRAVLRAIHRDTTEGGVQEGGSTITQQYVKNAILGDERTIKRKVQEAALAFQFERKYTKERILELYLNTIYFGNGAYGVQAAAFEYFGKQVSDLVPAESALLAGLIRSPVSSDPYDHPEIALARRDLVITKMGELRLLPEADVAAALATPVQLAAAPAEQRYPAGHFVEEVKQFILDDPRFGETPTDRRNLLFNGGLRIYTTLDLGLQQLAEDAVNNVLNQPDVDPDAALVSLEPTTGFVRAMVGGRDFFGGGTTAKFNLAVGDKTQPGRPTGSAFKPIVLAAALESGIPLTEQLTAPGSIDIAIPGQEEPWHVSNADPGESLAAVDLVEGTVHSYNTLYAQLIMQVGPDKAIAMAERLGIRTPLEVVPSAVLGANNVRVIDMASVYATFANRGVTVPPVLVTRITRPDGTVLFEHRHDQRKAIDAVIADKVTSVLEQVIVRGTGTRAQLDRPAAGKTGTGQLWGDAWFCGYTPALSTAVWVGFHEGEISMDPPRTRIRVYGGTWPAQIWHDFMAGALANVAPAAFVPPPTTTTLPTPVTSPPATKPPAVPVSVPNVVGYPADQATRILNQAGLLADRVEIYRPDVAPGTVTNQSPPGGATAPSGSTVVIEVAGAEQPGNRVPLVIGLPSADAQANLQAAGFGVAVIEQPNGAAEPGTVWLQDPAAGDRAPAGSVVTIWVATG